MRPLVYGYIRVFPCDPRRQPDSLRNDIEVYAHREGLLLAEVFVERTAAEGYGERPAFTALMEALRPGKAYAVIVPGLRHLSRFSGVQFFVCSLIQRETGARVISLEPPHPPPGLVVEPK
jgi:DNA invertase Pin-like site-specific DNA recombinase